MTTRPDPLDRHAAAKVLAELKADILRQWEMLAREKVDAARKQSRLALRDSLPQFMDQLIATLKSADPKSQAAENADIAKDHAEDRAKQPEYTLGEVIVEYQILRSVIANQLESKDSFDLEARNIVHEFIDHGICLSSERFSELDLERIQAQNAEIEATKSEAERANLAKTSFLANISHEIRTPLGAIMGFVSLLRDEGRSQEDANTYLGVIDRNSHHVLRIIDDILDLTKVEVGKMVIEKTEFSLVEFLAEFASLFGFKARENGLTFEFSADTPLPENILSDPTRLRQILSNIVGNAIKFTEKGRVELLVSYNDGHLEFRVTDTGRGISEEQRRTLFQAFSQADSSTTRRFGGTGLGLVLTKKLAQALGGDFDLVESKPGSGSVFEASIPTEMPVKAMLVPIKKFRIAPAVDDREHTSLKDFDVLVVEDSPDNQMLLRMILQKVGAKVTVANDGLEGIEQALAKRYDVILMDIQMPNRDGHETTRELRSKGYSGPIVALTAHAMKEEHERAMQSGFSHFMTKPIDRKSLLDLLEVLKSAIVLRN